jgi:hypothetical protein
MNVFLFRYRMKKKSDKYIYILHASVHSHVFTSRCLVAAFNGERSPSSGFTNGPRPQLPASNSNSSQQLNLSSSLTNSLAD